MFYEEEDDLLYGPGIADQVYDINFESYHLILY